MSPRLLPALALLSVLSLTHAVRAGEHAPAAPAASVSLPDTAPGRVATAFLAAFNSGDDAAMRAFEETHRAASARAMRSTDDRLAQFRSLRARWGDLAARSVLASGELDLTLLIHQSAPDAIFSFTFECEPASPHGLIAIRIEGPLDPAEAAAKPAPLTADERAATINALADALESTYVFPDKGREMAETLRARLASGAYDAEGSSHALARRLTQELQAQSRDLHLGVRARAAAPQARPNVPIPNAQPNSNYSFEKAELLPGGIGYVKFNAFPQGPEAERAAAAALAAVADCRALIFDVRDNGGGSPEMIRFISSYLFDKPTHLNSFYDRAANKTSETWTTTDIPGNRFDAALPVYVLTSARTFSAAEEFTYNLKNLKRATIVGETTGGGAHPVQAVHAGDRFVVMVPYARAVNPITGTNWEGVGVEPDIKCPNDKALETACEHARKALASR